ncbi:hypothetical protein BC332_18293 [Capsicum chinense]|nr:hypothetical protein BC332_18293 [Capsicum chinense]
MMNSKLLWPESKVVTSIEEVIYGIWNEKNLRVFQQQYREMDSIAREIAYVCNVRAPPRWLKHGSSLGREGVSVLGHIPKPVGICMCVSDLEPRKRVDGDMGSVRPRAWERGLKPGRGGPGLKHDPESMQGTEEWGPGFGRGPEIGR